ncbi:MAG: hypothetical protein IJ645_10815 [Ruminococcus sp.]|nr:hypothetical protein [Ruminococcus sp.]
MHTKGEVVKLASVICAITVTLGVGAMAIDSKAIAKDNKTVNRQASVEEQVAIAQPLTGAAVNSIELKNANGTYGQLILDQQAVISEQKVAVMAAAEAKVKQEAADSAKAAKAALDEKNAQEKKVAEAAKRAAEEKKKEEAAKKAAEEARAKAAQTQTQVQVVEYVEVVEEEEEEEETASAQTTQTASEEKEETSSKAAAVTTTTAAKPAASDDNDGLYMNPTYDPNWNSSSHLSSWSGVYYGPSGKETYYNLNMSGVVSIMRGMGFSEDKYPYWVRDDGCKMLGNYIMVAADLGIRARGTLVPTSLGTGIVCDTGGFAASNRYQLDIATNW